MFFEDYFDITGGPSEIPVCCPFPHSTANGLPYYETRPSASVNTDKGVFHCMACGKGMSEAQFIQEIFQCSYLDAKRIQRCFNTDEDVSMWENLILDDSTVNELKTFNISEEIITQLKIKTPPNADYPIAFPVFMFGHLLDVRMYNTNRHPKAKSRTNCPSGFILPFDLWLDSPENRVTLICAGEKDMAVARTHGFNAITLTGGEGTPCKTPAVFKDRPVVIAYDNDEAGLRGAKKLARQLQPYAKYIKILTNFHEICCEKGEDITDFFNKYHKTKHDLIELIKNTPEYELEPEEAPQYPVVTLLEATKAQNHNKLLQSNIQVVATSDATFVTPAAVLGEKTKFSGDKDTMNKGDIKEWELTDNNCEDILYLVDNNFKEEAVKENLRNLMHIPKTERFIKMSCLMKKTVFKYCITDLFETTSEETVPMEFVAYSIEDKLESGKKYLATYKLVPHPYHGQQLIMIITSVVQANDSVSNFKITPEIIENLKTIQNIPGTVPEKMHTLTEKVKGLLNYNGNNLLIKTIDLCFNTPLYFNFGAFKKIRGYLDTLIVGESRVGKSSTADALRKEYELGVFTSLAGNAATIPGLIGGSNKQASGYQTRAGIIPQNHKGLIIFEEFGKSNANVLRELTDIRSSNEVRITRVSGTLTLPATVRMISLTNVKAVGGMIKPIATYPNGFSIITELVDTAEDIARYDVILILSERGNTNINPFWEPEEPLPKEVSKTRIRWIWSRKPEDIIMPRDVANYVISKANDLNETYNCHIKLFGTEAWKKLARLSIAIAGYLVSASEDYTKIIVQKDHVDYAVDFFKEIYDNSTFKLKEYVDHERKYTEIDEDGVYLLQDIYNKYPGLILQMEQCSAASKNTLAAASGLSNDDLNKALNRLTKGLFIRFQGYDIVPTERFRIGLSLINKNTSPSQIGEE